MTIVNMRRAQRAKISSWVFWGRCKPRWHIFVFGCFWEHLRLISEDIIELLIDHPDPVSSSANPPDLFLYFGLLLDAISLYSAM